jgi:mRNA-degrading endonuclease HigB of HigAB toxin-antitoxin module
MTVANTKALELLGKDVSFEIDELVPEIYKDVFPAKRMIYGKVEAVLIHISGNHEILVGNFFYPLDEIEMK